MTASPVRYGAIDVKRTPLTLPEPTNYQLPQAGSQTHWKGRLAVRLGLDDKTRTVCSSRVAYRKQLLADLEAAGAQGKTKWLDRTKVAEVPRARAFLGAHEFTLKHMSAAQFKDGADAVKSAFMVWAQARLDEASRYELPQPSSPGSAVEGLVPASLRIPEEAWQRVASAELYRRMDEIGLPHGEGRVTCARQLLKNLDEIIRSGQAAVDKSARAAHTEEEVPLARRGSLAAEPAVLTLAQIREQIEKVLPGAARLRGDAPAAAAASPSKSQVKLDHHVLMHEPPADAGRHDEWWFDTRGALLAFFAGEPSVDRLIQTLGAGAVDETQRARAVELLKSDGRRSDAFNANWSALKALVRRAGLAAAKLHANLSASGIDVPAMQARAFARAELGARFEAQPDSYLDRARRNRLAVDVYRRVDPLASGGQAVSSVALRQAVDEALASGSPATPARPVDDLPAEVEDLVPLHPLPEGSPRGDNKTSAASQDKAAAYQAQGPAPAGNEDSASPPSSAGKATRTRMVLRAPKTLHHSLDKVEGLIDSAARAPKPEDKAAFIKKARQELHSADQEFQRAAGKAAEASPGKEPHWVGGARKRVAALDKSLAAVEVAAEQR